ncbi:MAG: ATP-binding protein [Bacteriovoracia bacterium]
MKRSLLFFSICFPIVLGIFLLAQNWLDDRRNFFLRSQELVIQNSVQERFRLYLRGAVAAETAVGEFWERGNVDDKTYSAMANHLIAALPETIGINEVDPNGKIIRVWPEKLNNPALGKISQNIQALKETLRKSERVWLSPPFTLYQGGQGFAYYLPLERKNIHVGWLAVVIDTSKFFDEFTKNEFGKSFHLSAIEESTGRPYMTGKLEPIVAPDYLIQSVIVEEFGRRIKISIWPKSHLIYPWYVKMWPIFVAILFTTILTVAFNWWEKHREAQNRLEELNQLLRLAIHDSASSLTSIRGYLDIMKEDPTLVPVERLSRHVGFVIDLLDQIKLVRKFSSSKESWKKERVTLLSLVLEVSDILSERLKNKDLFLRYDPEELSHAQLFLNRGLFGHSVLGNLITNAIKFSPTGTTVSISYKKTNGTHQIDITDSGPGLPASTLKQIKEKPVMGDSNSFGLHIAQEVMGLHEGTLEILSPAKGGTIARITLPENYFNKESNA